MRSDRMVSRQREFKDQIHSWRLSSSRWFCFVNTTNGGGPSRHLYWVYECSRSHWAERKGGSKWAHKSFSDRIKRPTNRSLGSPKTAMKMFAASFGRHMCMNFYKPTMGKILHVNDAGFSVPVFRETRRIKKFLLLHSFRIAQGFFELLACALLLLALSRDHQRPNN